jgi:hypothetical protein
MKKLEPKGVDEVKKKPGASMKLSNQNSFSILDNDEIAKLAGDMGVLIHEENFDTIDIMKDLEVASQALAT